MEEEVTKMKLIMSIVDKKDDRAISSELMKGGFVVTKMASGGGFLRSKQTTLLCAVRDEDVVKALDIIKTTCHGHKYSVHQMTPEARLHYGGHEHTSNEIVMGGATVFVLNIEENYKY